MLTPACQRWRGKRCAWRPADELVRTSEYEVAELESDSETKRFVLEHHYSGAYPAARWRFGLYRRGTLSGVAVFSHPASDAVLTRVYPGEATDSVELGRLVLLDDVGGNGESWFVSRCLHSLRREGVRGVVSFSDPVPRSTSTGEVLTPGHVGVVYQALSAIYLGRATPRTLRLLPDGRVLSARALQKLRAGERGWEYVARTLEAAGAEQLPTFEERAQWLARWVPALTRKVRHPGNHRYALPLSRSDGKRLRALAQPYPRRGVEF